MAGNLTVDPNQDRDPPAGRRRPRGVEVVVLLSGLVAITAGVIVAQHGLTRGRNDAAITERQPSQPSIDPSRGAATATAKPTSPVGAHEPVSGFVFPVAGPVTYAHTHHDYPATDIMAACGTPVVAVTSGVVLETTLVDTYDPKVDAGATRGGLSVSILGDDGVRYYGSHLSAVDAKVKPGVRLSPGQRIGTVGRTGNASACHLHFGMSPPCMRVGDWWIRRGVIWPWPYLDAWRRHRDTSAVAETTLWWAAHGCPTGPLVDP